jgi:hypothetical protein
LKSEVDGEEDHPNGGTEGEAPAKDGSWKPIPSGKNSTRPIHSLPKAVGWVMVCSQYKSLVALERKLILKPV